MHLMPSLLSVSPEATLLYLTAGSAECDSEIQALLGRGVDHARVYALAARERAIPVVWERLQRFDIGRMATNVASSYARYSAVSHFRLLHLEQRLDETLTALAGAGIPVLLLKDAAPSRTVYGSLVHRRMIDLDLLVDPALADRARTVLLQTRWQKFEDGRDGEFYLHHHHQAPLADADRTGFTLELHTQPVDAAPRFGLASGGYWEASLEAAGGGRGFRVPSTPHQLVHLAVHFAWSHGMASAGWRTFRDLSAITTAGAIEWDAVVTLARGGAASCCYWTFRLANRLTRTQVPEEVISALRPRRSRSALRLLELHYASDLLLPEVFPSASLRRALWTLGIAPEAYGHGGVRPWDHDDLLAAPPTAAGRHGLKGFSGRVSARERYLRTVLGYARAVP